MGRGKELWGERKGAREEEGGDGEKGKGKGVVEAKEVEGGRWGGAERWGPESTNTQEALLSRDCLCGTSNSSQVYMRMSLKGENGRRTRIQTHNEINLEAQALKEQPLAEFRT